MKKTVGKYKVKECNVRKLEEYLSNQNKDNYLNYTNNTTKNNLK